MAKFFETPIYVIADDCADNISPAELITAREHR